MTPVFYSYFLSASALAAMSLGAAPTGRANPETLAALRIENRLKRAP